jgi:sulfite reductase (NADPH) flavoprotein alpha-component
LAASPSAIHATPVSGGALESLQSVVADFDHDQLLWSSGYLAGLARAADPHRLPHPVAEPAADRWTVFFATETGNSRRVAQGLADRAREAGLAVELQDLRDIRPKALGRAARAAFVLATHGIGEPPDGTEAFFEFWNSKRAPKLENLEYSILALGDSSYADFCAMGRLFDDRLRALGARAVIERIDCDLDFEEQAETWTGRVVDYAREHGGATAPANRRAALRAVSNAPSKDRPFAAEILLDQPITGRGSSKDVRHIELNLEGSGLRYLPGDSLGVVPQNPPPLVEAVLAAAKLDGSAPVKVGERELALAEALTSNKEITVLNRPLLERVAQHHDALKLVLEDRVQLQSFFETRQVIDLLSDYPNDWEPQELVDAFRKLSPRLYSIASSPDANPDEAHLTVSVVAYEQFGRRHWGAASNHLVGEPGTVPVYVEENDRFRLPADGDTPIIMIGAGTGVAPYRAFVEHRQELGHGGDNWLVFGDRNFASDFLYQLEWLRYRKDGILTRLDVAFSRDRAEKVYVQHRIREQGRDLYAWLERGAHLYVCGDATRMAVDVHNALLEVVEEQGGLSPERAAEYLNELKSARRYQRDVY